MQSNGIQNEWINWSGSIRFNPKTIEMPHDENDLKQLVSKAIAENINIRTVGSSHSCSRIFETKDILISMERFKSIVAVDGANLKATVGAGMTVEEIGEELFEHGLGLENTGHINKQTIAGAISTGTHGAGKNLPNMSGQVVGLKMITGTGEQQEFNIESHAEIMQALKVSLGSMGLITEVQLRVLPAFKLRRIQYCASLSDCLNHLDEMMNTHRNFCFYWYPRRDDVSLRTWNFEDDVKKVIPFGKIYKEYSGWGKDVLPTHHELKYNELEYSVDASAAVSCFQEIRKRVLAKHRKIVGWRILFRPIAKDDVFLSNSYGRNTVAITIHQNASLPYKEYFEDIESVFKAHGGRPHWGKKHSMNASELKKVYPMWNQFQKIRQEMDPHGIFLNAYLKRVFIEE